MLGYTSLMTSEERLNHHKNLQQKFGNELKAELNFAYAWVSNPSFLQGLDNKKRKDVLAFCKSSIENPPIRLLNHMMQKTERYDPKFSYKSIEPEIESFPKCNLCGEKLADSIVEVVNFSEVSCRCGKRCSHVDCADKYIESNPQCVVCKKYFLLEVRNSTLRQMLLKF
jgi:hypothetical protein